MANKYVLENAEIIKIEQELMEELFGFSDESDDSDFESLPEVANEKEIEETNFILNEDKITSVYNAEQMKSHGGRIEDLIGSFGEDDDSNLLKTADENEVKQEKETNKKEMIRDLFGSFDKDDENLTQVAYEKDTKKVYFNPNKKNGQRKREIMIDLFGFCDEDGNLEDLPKLAAENKIKLVHSIPNEPVIQTTYGKNEESECLQEATPDKKQSKKADPVHDKKMEKPAGDGQVTTSKRTAKSSTRPKNYKPSTSSICKRQTSDNGPILYGGDVMITRKREERGKRKRKIDEVEIINDNKNICIISDIIKIMNTAAEQDRELNGQRKPAIRVMQQLPYVKEQLKNVGVIQSLSNSQILSSIAIWLAPLPNHSLPFLEIREVLLKQLLDYPSIGREILEASGLAEAVVSLLEHPKETIENKSICNQLLKKWAKQLIFQNVEKQQQHKKQKLSTETKEKS
ncbi:hypothetical protein HELRODRAFT_165535 [Helobdella robusta]|uniref:TFIIS N-terminal domain-containing protein n=1 Tax=Helobdella robusta TaxID=6412 RepID=T1EWZ3_HELRO|nr:hypothetical protein HELRODRAFT_165535 [Helobdella robusta]ESN91493.1 hypothetical protein HELRODRAFT_165535 [Helobdella robusta]